jgi:predicted amidohydrolase YtcJ
MAALNNFGRISLAVLALAAAPARAAEEPADAVLRHGFVYTIDARDSVAQAIAIRAGRIVYVGSDAGAARFIGKATTVTDLGGRMVMPGLVDGHMHPLSGGGQLMTCNLNYEPLTTEQFQARIQACLDASKDKEPAQWLRVTGWYRQFMIPPGTDAISATLDSLKTERPIAVESTDGHSTVANSKALTLAGITAATADPSDGRVAREAGGQPTGMLEDGAQKLISAAIPEPSGADNLAMAKAALDAMRAQGVTSFLDAWASPAAIEAFATIARDGGLTARGHFAPVIDAKDAADPAAVVASIKSLIGRYDSGALAPAPSITVRNAKIFMDGVLQAPAQTAGLLAPYLVNRGTEARPHWVAGEKSGDVYFPPEILAPMLLALAQAGIEPHIHAIGDRSVRQALDGIAVMRRAVAKPDLRVAIAHAELVDPADYGRFRQLDAIPVMSFQWAKPGPDSIDSTRDYLGPARFQRMEPEGSLYAAGARIAYGSDWPVDTLNEWFALKVGVTRTGDPALGAKYAGRLNREKGLPRAAALRAITMNASYELHQDAETGSLEPGKFADLIVLDRNALGVPAEDIANVKVLLTLVGGREVYRAAGF